MLIPLLQQLGMLGGGGGQVFQVAASANLSFSAAPAGPSNVFQVAASDNLSFSALPASYSYLGRFRSGDVVPVVFRFVTPPDTYPIASIPSPSLSVSPYSTDGINFLWPIPLDVRFALGTFTVTCSYVIGGLLGSTQVSFDVVDGGNVGGRVISLCSYERPESRYVLAQLQAGSLVQGSNPHL